MAQAEFKIKSRFNDESKKGFVVSPEDPSKEIPIPNNGRQKSFTLKPNESLYIIMKQDGKIIELGNDFYIQIWPTADYYTLTKTNDKCTIELKSLPRDCRALGATVTVGDGKPGQPSM